MGDEGWYPDPYHPTHLRWWNGEIWSSDVRISPRASSLDRTISPEQDVVALIIEGRTNVEIAQRLLMSRETAKTHLSHIYTKLHVRTRAQLAALAATRAAQQR